MPIAKSDRAIVAAAAGVNAAAILLRTVYMVGKLVVHGHVIELRGGLVVPGAPSLASIHAHAHALIAAKEQSLGIGRVDPESVIVIASGSALDGLKGLAAIR